MPRIVDARRHLVEHRAVRRREELAGEQPDMAERIGDPDRELSGLRRLSGDEPARRQRRGGEDAILVDVVGRGVGARLAILPAAPP